MTRTPSPHIAKHTTSAIVPRQTKAALLRARLAEPGGASMTEMMNLTGWQEHTLRSALTGLRKTGVILSRRREGGDTIYAIGPAGSLPAPDGGGRQGALADETTPGIEANAPAISELGKGAA